MIWSERCFGAMNHFMKHVHPQPERKALIARLRKIKGQVQGIENMLDEGADCPEVLMQVVSARRALKSFGDQIIHSHLHDCIENGDPKRKAAKNSVRF